MLVASKLACAKCSLLLSQIAEHVTISFHDLLVGIEDGDIHLILLLHEGTCRQAEALAIARWDLEYGGALRQQAGCIQLPVMWLLVAVTEHHSYLILELL